MLGKVRAYAEKWKMFTAEDTVIVGVSGGVDSVCLFLMLLELREEIGFQIVAVHVNHELRGAQADADESYVRTLCETYGIPCMVYRRNVEWIAKKRKQSTEEAGRDIRREAFFRTMEEMHGTKIALAHHKNDNAETLLLNLSRGTGLKGLGGMRPVSGVVVRPLLCLERAEIEEYVAQRGVPYCVDATNGEDDYTRNRIRNHVIPYLESQVNEKAVEHMAQAMERLRGIEEYIDRQAEVLVRTCVSESGVIRREAFEKIPEVLRSYVLKKLLTEAAGHEKDIQAVHVEALEDLLEKQVGRELNLPYGVTAVRCYEGVQILRKAPNAPQPEGICDLLSGTAWTCADMDIRMRVWEKGEEELRIPQKTYTKWFDCDIIKGTIDLRTRRPGDYITIDREGNTQKLKSYFINEKIPREERDRIWLIAEGSHVLWIVGYRMSSAYQVKTQTKNILEIAIEKKDEGEE